jgi:hypothetical protein
MKKVVIVKRNKSSDEYLDFPMIRPELAEGWV